MDSRTRVQRGGKRRRVACTRYRGGTPFIAIFNPNPTVAASLNVTYNLGDGTSQVQTAAIAPNSRATIAVKDIPGEGEDIAHDFSATVETTNGVQIIVDGVVYFDYAGREGGHSLVGLAH